MPAFSLLLMIYYPHFYLSHSVLMTEIISILKKLLILKGSRDLSNKMLSNKFLVAIANGITTCSLVNPYIGMTNVGIS